MAVDPSLVGPASLAVTQTVAVFTTFLPKWDEIRQKDPAHNPEFAADVRMAEIGAVCVTVGVGVIASWLTGSPVPAAVSGFAALGMVFMYEVTLRSDRPLETR